MTGTVSTAIGCAGRGGSTAWFADRDGEGSARRATEERSRRASQPPMERRRPMAATHVTVARSMDSTSNAAAIRDARPSFFQRSPPRRLLVAGATGRRLVFALGRRHHPARARGGQDDLRQDVLALHVHGPRAPVEHRQVPHRRDAEGGKPAGRAAVIVNRRDVSSRQATRDDVMWSGRRGSKIVITKRRSITRDCGAVRIFESPPTFERKHEVTRGDTAVADWWQTPRGTVARAQGNPRAHFHVQPSRSHTSALS